MNEVQAHPSRMYSKVNQKKSKYPLSMQYNGKKSDQPGEIVDLTC